MRKAKKYQGVIYSRRDEGEIFSGLCGRLALERSRGADKEFGVIIIVRSCKVGDRPVSGFVRRTSRLSAMFLFFRSGLSLLPLCYDRVVSVFSCRDTVMCSSRGGVRGGCFRCRDVSSRDVRGVIHVLTPMRYRRVDLTKTLEGGVSLFRLLKIGSIRKLGLSDE